MHMHGTCIHHRMTSSALARPHNNNTLTTWHPSACAPMPLGEPLAGATWHDRGARYSCKTCCTGKAGQWAWHDVAGLNQAASSCVFLGLVQSRLCTRSHVASRPAMRSAFIVSHWRCEGGPAASHLRSTTSPPTTTDKHACATPCQLVS